MTAEARALVQSELGAPVETLFSAFSEPVAAASIGQVHRATLPDGRRLSASDEDPLANGAPVALLASRSRYETELAPQGGSARCPSCVVEVVPVFLVNGQSLVPTGGYPTATTLDALTAATK